MMMMEDNGIVDMPGKDAGVVLHSPPAMEDSPVVAAIVSDDDDEEVAGDSAPLDDGDDDDKDNDDSVVEESDSDWEDDNGDNADNAAAADSTSNNDWLAVFLKPSQKEEEAVVSEDDVPDDEAENAAAVVPETFPELSSIESGEEEEKVVVEDEQQDVEMAEQEDEVAAVVVQEDVPEPTSNSSEVQQEVVEEKQPDVEMTEQDKEAAPAVVQEDVPEPTSIESPAEEEFVVVEDDTPTSETAAQEDEAAAMVQEDVPEPSSNEDALKEEVAVVEDDAPDAEMASQDVEPAAAVQEDTPEPSSNESPAEEEAVKEEAQPDVVEEAAAVVVQENVPEPTSNESPAEEEAVVVEGDTPDVEMAEASVPREDVPEPSSNESAAEQEEVPEDALNLIKEIDKEKVSRRQSKAKKSKRPSDTPSDKDYFEPSEAQAAKRKMQETRTSKELELEALRNRGLAGRKSRQLKKTINKNLMNQMRDEQHNMEFKKVAKGGDDDHEDNIEIGTMTTNSTIAAPPQLLPSPIHKVTSPSMAGYEQLAIEQQKERQRAREMEKEIMIQNQLHPESQQRKSMIDKKLLLEIDFVFGLLVGEKDRAPDMYTATKAAAKIVPNMLTNKKTIYYDPRYPPKVASIELDESYNFWKHDNSEEEEEGKEKDKKPIQKRYMVLGKVPVLPRNRKGKRKSSLSPKNDDNNNAIPPKSPTTTTSAAAAAVSTQPLTPPLTAATTAGGSASNSADKEQEELSLPSMETVPSGNVQKTKEQQQQQQQPKEETTTEPPLEEPATEEAEGILEGPMNTSSKDFTSPLRPEKTKKLVVDTRSSSTDIQSIRMSKDAELEAIRQMSPVGQQQKPKLSVETRLSSTEKFESLRMSKDAELQAIRQMSPVGQQKPKLTVDTRLSSTKKFENLKMSKDAELEAIRQRGVAKQKNLGFAQMEAQSALSKAAYEAEQQDLQKRKSGNSEFQFSAGKIVSPHDQLYLQHNKQNRSYREIQQKTREEYHRVTPSSGGGDGGSVSKKEEEEENSFSSSPSDEGKTTTTSTVNNNNKTTEEPVLSEPPSLSAKDQASRQSVYDKLFQKIRPKSKKSLEIEDEEEKSTEPEMSEPEQQRPNDAMFQKESFEPEVDVKSSEVKFEQLRKAKQEELKALQKQRSDPNLDVKSSELKFEQLRKAKEDELKALRERGLQHKTSDGKVRMASEGEAEATAASPRGSSGGLMVGPGMFVKESTPRLSGGNLNLNPPGVDGTPPKSSNPTGQEWRAIDDASPSRIKRTSLKNKEAEELAQLRQQGLAKQGSQQYAVFEKSSREAQLEYDAAAQDLARRKSQTSEYTYSGTKEIGPVDALYLDHQQWRKDIVKEEKEALGIFDEAPEHVDQEDVEGQVPVSNAKFTNTNGYQKWESGDHAVGDSGKKKKKKLLGVSSNCGCTIM